MLRLSFIILFFVASVAGAKSLSPEDVLRLTRERSLVLQGSDLGPALAEQALLKTRSQYDLQLNAALSHTDDQSERSITVFGTASNSTKYNLSAQQLAPSGTLLSLAFNNERQSSNSPFQTINPLYDSRTVLNVTQPILKNYFGFATRGVVSISQKILAASADEAESRRQDQAYQNLVLFWNWYLQHQMYALDTHAVELAKKSLKTNLEKLSLGLIERIDLYNFESNLDAQMDALLTVKEQVLKMSEDLRAALDLTDEAEKITPVSRTVGKSVAISLETSLANALAGHPLLNAIRKDLESREIDVTLKKNARLPQLDLVASLTLNGIDDNYATSVGDISAGNAIWSGGVNLSFPLQNRAARADFETSLLEKKRKLISLRDAENKIIALVRQSHQRVRNNSERMGVTSRLVDNKRKKWEGEIERYNQGRSSPDTVIRYQDEYVIARKQHLLAVVAFEMAKLDLLFASGELR